MFYLKNDDMEEMFKKAADNYELNEEMAADWNSVRAELNDTEALVTSTKKEKKRNRFFALWWLLLIPGILMITYKAGVYNSSEKQNIQAATTKKSAENQEVILSKKENKIPGNKSDSALLNTNKINNVPVNNKKNLSIKNEFISKERYVLSSVNNKSFHINAPGVFADTENKTSGNNNFALIKQSNQNFNKPATDSLTKFSLINSDQVKNKDTGIVNNNTNYAAGTNVSTPKSKKKNNNYTRKAFAYAGITGNADLSFIKFQKASLPGLGAGIITGYHFKNGLSIETGLLYDKKNYYTKGEYFNKNSFSYLKDVNLLTANGNCHMWELPLNFQYDFRSSKKYNWFVTSGVSSYFMHKEFYNFKYEKNGTVKEMANDYYHSSPDWFSAVNVGAGINVHIAYKYFLQAQPYYKIPLSGIGKGNLSLNSGGINISIKRIIH